MLDYEVSDAELVHQARLGRDVAFTALMRRHKERLFRLVRRHVGDDDEALDILQESFVAAWSALARFDTERSFYIWLSRIALNRCRDRARRLAVRRVITSIFGSEDAHAVADEAPSPEIAASDRDALRRLDKAIASLPIKLREPLILTAIDGMTQTEAADVLGVSVKAIETRVYRARAKLAAAFPDD